MARLIFSILSTVITMSIMIMFAPEYEPILQIETKEFTSSLFTGFIYKQAPDYLEKIPDSLGNFRYKQPSLSDLEEIVKCGMVKTIIRLNGNGKDSGGVSVDQEKEIAEKAGIQFFKMTVEGREQNINKVIAVLEKGQALIHCRHGYDRTGAAVGKHLRNKGFTKEEVIAHNNWETYYKKGESYQKYFDKIK